MKPDKNDQMSPFSDCLNPEIFGEMKIVHDTMVGQFSGKNRYFRALEFQKIVSVEVVDTLEKLDSALDHLVT